MQQYDQKTIAYKTVGNSQPVLMDIYFPPMPPTKEVIALPVIVNFHAGGLCVGNRKNMLPFWLIDRVLPLGYVFVSADYRLLIPGTAEEIVEDVQDLFKFIANANIQGNNYTFRLDGGRIGVCGSSGGGLCAYLCAVHCSPKPKFVLSIYGMGGDFFTHHLLDIKLGEITAVGQQVAQIDSSVVSSLVDSHTEGALPKLAVSDAPFDGEIPEELRPRIGLFYFLFQRGVYLDYYTGLHNPSISNTLRGIIEKPHTREDLKRALPKEKHRLFPQLSVDSHWPPTIILHGVSDDIVLIEESRNISGLISKAGVLVELIEVLDENHIFDISPEAEIKHGVAFDKVKDFIRERL